MLAPTTTARAPPVKRRNRRPPCVGVWGKRREPAFNACKRLRTSGRLRHRHNDFWSPPEPWTLDPTCKREPFCGALTKKQCHMGLINIGCASPGLLFLFPSLVAELGIAALLLLQQGNDCSKQKRLYVRTKFCMLPSWCTTFLDVVCLALPTAWPTTISA